MVLWVWELDKRAVGKVDLQLSLTKPVQASARRVPFVRLQQLASNKSKCVFYRKSTRFIRVDSRPCSPDGVFVVCTYTYECIVKRWSST